MCLNTDSQVVVLFGTVVEPSGGETLLEDANHGLCELIALPNFQLPPLCLLWRLDLVASCSEFPLPLLLPSLGTPPLNHNQKFHKFLLLMVFPHSNRKLTITPETLTANLFLIQLNSRNFSSMDSIQPWLQLFIKQSLTCELTSWKENRFIVNRIVCCLRSLIVSQDERLYCDLLVSMTIAVHGKCCVIMVCILHTGTVNLVVG